MNDAHSRRRFLFRSVSGFSATWAAFHWPAVLAAADHGHSSGQSAVRAGFEFFSPEMAAEIEAVTARIIPSNETPGAREAGVVYFIDRALTTFASNDRKLYAEGTAELQSRTREMFPAVERFSAATTEQQDEILRLLDKGPAFSDRPFRPRPLGQNFFETLRQHTILGFLIDPDADRRGNRDAVGWRVIGREREHMFRPPFGFYDKDYPGWQPVAAEPEKK